MPIKALEHWIATQNIARFQASLETETDEVKRSNLEVMLAAERLKLGDPIPVVP
jgi:hypothetical protein